MEIFNLILIFNLMHYMFYLHVFSVAQVNGGVHEDLQLDLHDATHLPLVWMPSGHHDHRDGGGDDNDGHDDDDEDILRCDILSQLL